MRTLEHVLFSFLFAGVNSISLLYFLFWKKKGFENRVFEIRKHGSTRRSVLIYIYIIYIYTGKESRKHPYHPIGDNYTHPFPFIFFIWNLKKFFTERFLENPFYSSVWVFASLVQRRLVRVWVSASTVVVRGATGKVREATAPVVVFNAAIRARTTPEPPTPPIGGGGGWRARPPQPPPAATAEVPGRGSIKLLVATNDERLASSSSTSHSEAGTTVSTRLGVRELVDGTSALASRMAFRLALILAARHRVSLVGWKILRQPSCF